MTDSYQIFQVDAFTNHTFGGNPAAVVPLKSWLDTDVMQAIALENNLSETAFFVPLPGQADADYELRWFTPTVEVDLCGHATLATSAVLFEKLAFSRASVRFQTRSGLLTAIAQGDRIELDFPAAQATATIVPDGLAEALGGIEPVGLFRGPMHMAILSSEEEVRNAKPDFDFIAAHMENGLIITAKGDEANVASRYFAPNHGIDEDPVTGSAHTMIVPYWVDRFGGRMQLHCRQVSERVGDLYCELAGDRVRMAGNTRIYLEGTIHI